MTHSIAAHEAGPIILELPVVSMSQLSPLCIESKAGQSSFPCMGVVWQHDWGVPYLSSLP